MANLLSSPTAEAAAADFNNVVDHLLMINLAQGVDLKGLSGVAYTGSEQVAARNNEDMTRAPSGPVLS